MTDKPLDKILFCDDQAAILQAYQEIMSGTSIPQDFIYRTRCKAPAFRRSHARELLFHQGHPDPGHWQG